MMSREFALVLHEKPVCEGLSRAEAIDMIDMLMPGEFYPIEIMAKRAESSAMGFISAEFANEIDYDYENSGLNGFIANILDDMDEENDKGTYRFKDRDIWLTR